MLGIGIGVAAVLILYKRADGGDTVPIPILFFVMAVAASAFERYTGSLRRLRSSRERLPKGC